VLTDIIKALNDVRSVKDILGQFYEKGVRFVPEGLKFQTSFRPIIPNFFECRYVCDIWETCFISF
jgi:hypothetical protein